MSYLHELPVSLYINKRVSSSLRIDKVIKICKSSRKTILNKYLAVSCVYMFMQVISLTLRPSCDILFQMIPVWVGLEVQVSKNSLRLGSDKCSLQISSTFDMMKQEHQRDRRGDEQTIMQLPKLNI